MRERLVASGINAFHDKTDIEHGDRFPDELLEALFAAKVVVLFAEPTYFTKRYCLWEWRVARSAFLAEVERRGSTEVSRRAALAGTVVALPPDGPPPDFSLFPAALQSVDWPSLANPDDVADYVTKQVTAVPVGIAERLERILGEQGVAAVRDELRNATALPPPLSLAGTPTVPTVLPSRWEIGSWAVRTISGALMTC